MYTFAEDAALDAGFLLLMAGKEAYVNPFSVIGDIGKSYRTYYIGRLLQKLNLSLKQYPEGNQKIISGGVSKFPISFFHELSEENKKLHESIVKLQKEEIVTALKRRRSRVMMERVLLV